MVNDLAKRKTANVKREGLAKLKINNTLQRQKLLPIAPAFAKATAGKDCRLVRRSLSVGELPIAPYTFIPSPFMAWNSDFDDSHTGH
jgi:hypothetical protein